MKLRINIEDRDGIVWSLYDAITLEKITPPPKFNPIEHKLFNNDIFNYYHENNETIIVKSNTRKDKNIPCVLILVGCKSFGRHPTNHKKYYYKCVPNDKKLPNFIVPYEYKQNVFSKLPHNLYVTIQFESWKDKHPYGVIIQNIGSVDVNNNYCEYSIHCKNLNHSTSLFNKKMYDIMKNTTKENMTENILKKHKIESRMSDRIITIDPVGAMDYDDAFSVKSYDDYSVLSIYISNVTFWIEEFDLWDEFSHRVSSIYLPDKKRPMLPPLLSETLCSLSQNEKRFALTMDLVVKDGEGITDIRFTNTFINVTHNYSYDCNKLRNDITYQKTKELANLIYTLQDDNKKGVPEINGPRELVSYLMILMNYHSAKNMSAQSTNGIYRRTTFKNKEKIPDTLPNNIYKFLFNWNNYSGEYIHKIRSEHKLMNLECYIHITSPIRRIVDLLNMVAFQKNNSLCELNEKAQLFYDKWTSPELMENINTDMKSIKKIQNNCELLRLLEDKTKLEKTYMGILFNKELRNDGLFEYTVHLNDINITCQTLSKYEMVNYSFAFFKIYVFKEEENMRRKVRVSIYNEDEEYENNNNHI